MGRPYIDRAEFEYVEKRYRISNVNYDIDIADLTELQSAELFNHITKEINFKLELFGRMSK